MTGPHNKYHKTRQKIPLKRMIIMMIFDVSQNSLFNSNIKNAAHKIFPLSKNYHKKAKLKPFLGTCKKRRKKQHFNGQFFKKRYFRVSLAVFGVIMQ